MPTSCIWGDVVRCVLGHPRTYKWAWHRALQAFSEDVAVCQQDRLQACEWRHVHWHSGRFETGTDGILRSGQTPREDYLELLWLCYVFLGGSFDGDVGFHAPGAIHNARWIAKTLYSVKIFLFKDQVKLTARETAGLTSISLFVSLVYTRYWHEALIAERVPLMISKCLLSSMNIQSIASETQQWRHSIVTCGISLNISSHLYYLTIVSRKRPKQQWLKTLPVHPNQWLLSGST